MIPIRYIIVNTELSKQGMVLIYSVPSSSRRINGCVCPYVIVYFGSWSSVTRFGKVPTMGTKIKLTRK